VWSRHGEKLQSILSPTLVHHQVLVIVFVVQPREDIFVSLFPDNDAINVVTLDSFQLGISYKKLQQKLFQCLFFYDFV
jgi:hypothetical protein